MWAKGPAAGFLVTSALVGVTYALSQVGVVSFFPLDIAQAGIRLTPGQIATQGIEAFGHEAKMLAEATALAVVLLAGAAAGAVVVRFGLQRNWSNILPLAAATIALIAIAQMIGGTLPDVISLGATAGLMLGWSVIAPGRFSRRDALRRAAVDAFGVLGGSVLLLIPAGLIEAYVTPHCPAPVRWSVALASTVFLVAYLGGAGRAKSQRT